MKQYRLSNLELSWLCRELAILIHAGVMLGDGLSALAEEEGGTLGASLAALGREIDGGKTLSAAMEAVGGFPAYVTGLLEVGERTGRTEQSLDALAQYYARREGTQQQLRSVLTYPVILLLLMLVVITVLLTRVLPVFNEVYASLGSGLSGFAGGLLRFGEALAAATPVLCVLLGGAAVFVLAFSLSNDFRDKVLRRWQSRRGDRGIARKLNDAQFAQALAMGMRSGLAPAEAIALTGALFADTPEAARRCSLCAESIEAGRTLPDALEHSGMLPRAACRLLSFGLRGGTGDRVMEDIAARLSDEAERALATRIAQVEPTLVLATSLLVGAILLSVMLPLMNIMSAIG